MVSKNGIRPEPTCCIVLWICIREIIIIVVDLRKSHYIIPLYLLLLSLSHIISCSLQRSNLSNIHSSGFCSLFHSSIFFKLHTETDRSMEKIKGFAAAVLVVVLVALFVFFVKHEIDANSNHDSPTPPAAFQPFYPPTIPIPSVPVNVYAPPPLYPLPPPADQKEEETT